jgi:hypothetical protein
MLVKFLRAFMAGVKRVQSEPEFGKKILAQYLRLREREGVREKQCRCKCG